MRGKILSATTLLLVGFTIGALLGRRWRGDQADFVFALILLLTGVLIFVLATDYVRDQLRRLPSHPEPVEEKQPGRAMVPSKHMTWPQGWSVRLIFPAWKPVLRVQLPESPASPLLNIARQAIIERPWRAGVFLMAWILVGILLQQLPTLPLDADYSGAAIIWVLAFILFALAVAPPRPRPRQDLRLWWHLHWRAALTLSVIALVGLVLRVWQLETIPFTLGGDEASQGLETLRVIRGEIRSPFATGWYSVPTLSFYFNSVSLLWLGQTITALRLPWALVGTLTILGAFWLVTRLKGPRLGLMTAGLLAVYHYHIHYSRLGSNQIADPFFATFALLFLYRALSRKSPLDWTLLGVVGALSMYFYAGARLTLILILTVMAYYLLRERLRFWREHRIGLLIALGAFLIVGAPILQYAVRFPSEYNARINQVGILQSGWLAREVSIRGVSAEEILLDQFTRAALAFNFYPDRTVWYGLRQPLLDPLFGAIFLLGLGYATLRALTPNADRRLFPMVAWWWSAIILGGMLTESPPSSMRLVTASVPTCFFIALAIRKLLRLAKKTFTRVPSRVLITAGVVAFSAISLKTYFVDFIPQRIYGGQHAEIATELAPILNQLGPTYRFYFLGAPWMYWGFSTIPYLAPNVEGSDITDPLTSPPPATWATAGRGVVFIFLPERIREMDLVRQTFPEGEIQELDTPRDGHVIVTLYRVPP